MLLKAAERVYGLVKAFAGCLTDKRAPEKIRHTLADVIGQRIFGIACGHPDGNDADHPADDPVHKLPLGRDPVTGARLASQPTIPRFENGVSRTALYRMGRELAAGVIDRHRCRLHGRARRITIDLDPTDDRTHGAQQYSFFNEHYGAWCYLPQLAFLTFDRGAEQYLCAAVLRPGRAVALRRGRRPAASAAAPAAGGVSAGAVSRAARRRFRDPGALRLPGCRTAARLRGGDGEERGVGAAGRAGHGGRAGAE